MYYFATQRTTLSSILELVLTKKGGITFAKIDKGQTQRCHMKEVTPPIHEMARVNECTVLKETSLMKTEPQGPCKPRKVNPFHSTNTFSRSHLFQQLGGRTEVELGWPPACL